MCLPLPLLGVNLVTLFSNVHVFKVISLLKCNFLTFSQIGRVFLKVIGVSLGVVLPSDGSGGVMVMGGELETEVVYCHCFCT